MTRIEAIKKMLDGNKISHRLFDEKEYLYIDENLHLRDETHYQLDWDDFWHYRKKDYFYNDWIIYKTL